MLGMADQLILTEVYAAGEPPIVAADGRALVRAVRLASQRDPAKLDSTPSHSE